MGVVPVDGGVAAGVGAGTAVVLAGEESDGDLGCEGPVGSEEHPVGAGAASRLGNAEGLPDRAVSNQKLRRSSRISS